MSNRTVDASIIIPVHNQAFLTRVCLKSLETEQSGAEIIVVDNGSNDSTPELLQDWAQLGQGRRYLRHDENLGFARGCNAGARQASGRILVFLNNDIFVLSGWLSNLLEPFAESSVAVTGSRLLYPSGHIQHAGIAFNDSDPCHIFGGLPGDLPAALIQRDYQAVTGASMAIRASVFERLQGFCTDYENSYEDVDLCLRVGTLGHRVLYVPGSVAYHWESMTEGRLDESDERNRALFKQRWLGRYRVDLLQWEKQAVAEGSDLSDGRVLTRRELVNLDRAEKAESARLRAEAQSLRAECDDLRRNAASLQTQVDTLRPIANMRIVRVGLRARRLLRRVASHAQVRRAVARPQDSEP